MEPPLAHIGGTQIKEREPTNDELFAEQKFEANTKRYEDPKVAEAEKLKALEAMGMKPFTPPERKNSGSNLEQAESAKENADILKSPFTPFLERAINDGVISHKIGREIQGELVNNTDYESIIGKQEQLSENIRDHLIGGLDMLHSEEKSKEFKMNFEKDFKDDLQVFQNDQGTFLSDRTQEAFDMVGSAYFSGAESERSPDEQESSLEMAFETALNRALKGRSNLPTNKTFLKNIDLVRNIGAENGDISFNIRFTALTSILTEIHKSQGKNAKRGKRSLDATNRSAQAITAQTESKYAEYQTLLQRAQESGDSKKIAEAKQLIAKSKEDSENPIKGEVLSGGKLDVAKKVSQENITQNS